MGRNLTAVAALVAAIFVLPSASFAQDRSGDYTKGTGLWLGNDLGPGSIGFQATQLLAADDEFDYRRQSDGRGFHAEPLCVRVQGNEARMVLAVQRSNLPEIESGAILAAVAIDNGNGQDDLFDLNQTPPNVACDAPFVFDPDPVRGDIQVVASNPFGIAL